MHIISIVGYFYCIDGDVLLCIGHVAQIVLDGRVAMWSG